LDRQLSAALAPWRKPLARHDPAKVLDLAVALALGGDCLADVALLRAGPQLFGPVAADQRALTAIATAWATARARAWALAGTGAAHADVDSRRPLVVDLGGDQHPETAGLDLLGVQLPGDSGSYAVRRAVGSPSAAHSG